MAKKKHSCSMCAAPVNSPTGEHALPEQFLRRFNEANDLAFDEAYDLHALTYRGSSKKESKKLDNRLRVIQVPCCRACNEWLNENFEKPATEHLPKLLNGRTLFTSAQRDIAPLSKWIIKTILMCHHPRVHYQGLTAKSKMGFPSNSAVPHLLRELRNSGEPPQNLSLWATLSTRNQPAALQPAPEVTVHMGMNIRRPDGILRLTVSDSKEMSVLHPDNTRPDVLRLWPLCAGCSSCS